MNENIQMNNNTQKKNNGGIVLLIIVLFAAIIVGGVILLHKPDSDKSDDNSNSNSTSNSEQLTCISGKYANGEDKINIYCTKGIPFGSDKEETAVAYVKDMEESFMLEKGLAYYDEGVASDHDSKFEFKDGKLLYGKDKKEFTKVGEYSKEEYAKEVFNIDSTLFTGKYNTVYKKGNSTVIMYPVSSNEIVFAYTSNVKNFDNTAFTNEIATYSSSSFNGNNTILCTLKSNPDGSYSFQNTIFEKTTKINVVFGTNNVNITYSTDDAEDNVTYKDLNGVFTKSKTLTVDDILDNKFE